MDRYSEQLIMDFIAFNFMEEEMIVLTQEIGFKLIDSNNDSMFITMSPYKERSILVFIKDDPSPCEYEKKNTGWVLVSSS